ncbi:unnamed protein product [Lactuca virosa]|uniref:Uncharacterized protein n=1 Tax=Lactuca virosa TaxID=75947 RepID=A0AAU9MFZ4_9ASTR|nr:unnamed protein product [Lactuca virosa]
MVVGKCRLLETLTLLAVAFLVTWKLLWIELVEFDFDDVYASTHRVFCRSLPPNEVSPAAAFSPVKPPAGDRRTPTATPETVDPTASLFYKHNFNLGQQVNT